MKPIQIVLIGVALVAALGAGLLMMNLNTAPEPVKVAKKKKTPATLVLIADKPIPLGTNLTKERLKWAKWPKDNVRESFIIKKKNPKALEEYSKLIARSGFFAGEPIRDAKIVNSESGYLSAILPAGKRAMAISVRARTTAGGFVLPNDHVDIIMNRKVKKTLVTETILQNIRVLAVDRLIREKKGKKSKVGRTVTLELTAKQTEIIATARAIGSLTLALRSVEDSQLAPTDAGSHLLSSGTRKKRGTVRIIRYGQAKEVRPKK